MTPPAASTRFSHLAKTYVLHESSEEAAAPPPPPKMMLFFDATLVFSVGKGNCGREQATGEIGWTTQAGPGGWGRGVGAGLRLRGQIRRQLREGTRRCYLPSVTRGQAGD